jgi:hypothetical protein
MDNNVNDFIQKLSNVRGIKANKREAMQELRDEMSDLNKEERELAEQRRKLFVQMVKDKDANIRMCRLGRISTELNSYINSNYIQNKNEKIVELIKHYLDIVDRHIKIMNEYDDFYGGNSHINIIEELIMLDRYDFDTINKLSSDLFLKLSKNNQQSKTSEKTTKSHIDYSVECVDEFRNT